MKSWAQTYLAGAVFGTALIVAAFVAFVPLVSLQAPQDWSVPGFGLQDSVGGSGADVARAVAVAAGHDDGHRPDSTSSVGGSNTGTGVAAGSAVRTAAPLDSEPPTGGNGEAASGGHANGTTAIAPASAEVVAHNPGSLTPKGADTASPPSSVKPTEPGAPGSPASGEEGRGGVETAAGGPIPAGVVTGEEPETLPPPEEAPLPPVGESPTGGVTEPPVGEDENEVAPPGDGNVPVDSGLDLEPGAGGAEIADRSLADLALAAPGLVDVTADRQHGASRFDR